MGVVMTYDDFIKSLKTDKPGPIYLFYGKEKFLFSEVLRALKERLFQGHLSGWNHQEVDAGNLDAVSLYSYINAIPMSGGKYLLTIKNADKYFGSGRGRPASKDEEEVLLGYISDPNEKFCVVFMADEADGRRRLYKRLKDIGGVVKLSSIKGMRLEKWIKDRLEASGRFLTGDALEYLVTNTGGNLSMIENEIQKLLLFTDEDAISTEILEKIIGKSSTAGIFPLVDAVGQKNPAEAMGLIEGMLSEGEAPVYILFMLARQLRLMLRAKSLLGEGFSEKRVMASLQIHPYVFRKILRQSKNFTEDALQKGLQRLLEVDISLKTSMISPKLLLEMVVLALCLDVKKPAAVEGRQV
ncbi:MAG: DNA polymerase III subunit delta [Clostridia bacterium]|nr:DNA polymerase III subunit delta [Clostridia bacterium]